MVPKLRDVRMEEHKLVNSFYEISHHRQGHYAGGDVGVVERGQAIVVQEEVL